MKGSSGVGDEGELLSSRGKGRGDDKALIDIA